MNKIFKLNRILSVVFILLAIIYIYIAFRISYSHYKYITFNDSKDVYSVISQYNWKYWFETSSLKDYFSNFIKYIDINYIHTYGALALIINFIFMFSIFLILYFFIQNIFNSENRSNILISVILFSSSIFIFSLTQDYPIVWMFVNQQFASIFFTLIGYYLLIKLSLDNSKKYLYLLFIINIAIISTKYSTISLIVFLLLAYIIKIDRFKLFFIAILPLIIDIFFKYGEINSYITNMGIVLNNYSIDQLLKFILNYLGAIFSDISCSLCIATSTIVSSTFLILAFGHIGYLIFYKNINKYYIFIWGFLLFFILSAIYDMQILHNKYYVVAIKSNAPLSIISYILIFIFYTSYYINNENIFRRIMIGLATFTIFLYIYQIKYFYNYSNNIDRYQLRIYNIKANIDDPYIYNELLKSIYINFYTPKDQKKIKKTVFNLDKIKEKIIKRDSLRYIKDKKIFNKFNKFKKELKIIDIHSANLGIKSSIDKISKAKNGLYRVIGWIYNKRDKKVPNYILFIDSDRNIIGYGITGLPRKDVNKIFGKKAYRSGYRGYIKSDKIPKEIFFTNDKMNQIIKINYTN